MNDREFEQRLEQLLRQDLSVGTEAFRDALLARCLDELPGAGDEPRQLDIADLELVAAAGDAFTLDAKFLRGGDDNRVLR